MSGELRLPPKRDVYRPRHLIDGRMPFEAPHYDPQSADFIMVVGPTKKRFYVHSSTISTYSKFLKVASQSPHFKEGVEQLVKLPTMDPVAITILLKWFYGDLLDLPEDIGSDSGYDAMNGVLNAADYLEIDGVFDLVIDATQDHLKTCKTWNADREILAAGEQKKIDIMCRIYESGGKIEQDCLRAYIEALKESQNLGFFMNIVKELEDCHELVFKDIMTAVYSTVDKPKKKSFWSW